MLRIVDRHVLRQVSLPLGGALVIGLLMLLADRMVRLLDTTLGKKNSFAVVFEMLAYLVPHYLGTAIPRPSSRPAAGFRQDVGQFRDRCLHGGGRRPAQAGASGHHSRRADERALARDHGLGPAACALCLSLGGLRRPERRCVLSGGGRRLHAGGRPTFIIDELDRSKNAFQRAFIFQDKGERGSDTVTSARGQLIENPDGQRPTLHLEEATASPSRRTRGRGQAAGPCRGDGIRAGRHGRRQAVQGYLPAARRR